jgi:ferredoxin-NADP reductase
MINTPTPAPTSIQQKKQYAVTLVNRTFLSEKAFEIELTRPARLNFIPGHNIRFIYGDLQRHYTIISAPDEPKITLLVRHVPDGVFSSKLATAEIGTQFQIAGPEGYFTFSPSGRQPVFVATGTGIAPFVCMSRSGIKGFILLHGVSHIQDLYYKSVFHRNTCKYTPCISLASPADQLPANSFQGKVTAYLKKELPPCEYDFYLCGRREMVTDVTLLVDDTFPGSFVYHEVFF